MVPIHAPDQPANVKPAGGMAVSVTTVFGATVAEQTVPQLMPPTLLVTVPGLLVLTFKVGLLVVEPPPPPPPVEGIGVNVAPTFTKPPTITVQVGAEPEQAPVQPVKVLPLPAVAVNVSRQPLRTPPTGVTLQTMPQLRVLPMFVTLPLPFKVTESVGTGPAPTASPTNTFSVATAAVPLNVPVTVAISQFCTGCFTARYAE